MARFFMNYMFKSTKLPYAPMFVQLETTNACNLRCITCPTGCENISTSKGFMSFDLFRKLVDQAAELNAIIVVLHLGGEPLLHKELPQMVKLIKEKGMDVDFSSNGMLLTEEKSKALIEAGLDSIRVDFSPHKEEFERVRKGASWEQVRDNLLYLLRLKKELGRATPFVRLQNVVMSQNGNYDHAADIKTIREIFAGLPLDDICGFAIHAWGGQFAQNREQEPQYRKAHDQSLYYPCPHLWSQINVTWDGKVVACCRDIMSEFIAGDVNEKSLLEIWNDKPLTELRETLARGDYQKVDLCRSCTKLWEGNSPRQMVSRHVKKVAYRSAQFLKASGRASKGKAE